MGTRLGTRERVCELSWERGNVHGNSVGNVGTCMGTQLGARRTWERTIDYSLGTPTHVWDITLATVHRAHTILIIFIFCWQSTILHHTYVDWGMTLSVNYEYTTVQKPYIVVSILYINECTPPMEVCHWLQCAHIAILQLSTKLITSSVQNGPLYRLPQNTRTFTLAPLIPLALGFQCL